MDFIKEAFGIWLDILKTKFAKFEGRAGRKEYWMAFLVNFVLGFIPIVNILLALVWIIPGLACGIRRLHDTGRSGWWFLVVFIPLAGPFILIYFLVQPSQDVENKYGPKPV